MIPQDEILAARETISGLAVRTPLVRLEVDSDPDVWLKLETLQPVNSFKIRGAANAVLQASAEELRDGVLTPSAGNMAQGVALAARARGVPSTIVVPEGAPRTKLEAVQRLGGHIVEVPYEEWWDALVTGRYDARPGFFVHPAADERVMAGNGTIGLEILEDLPVVDAIVAPYGGGGLVTGVASAVKAQRPEVRVYAAEPANGAPAAASLAAGAPTAVEFTRSWVDGAGSREVIPSVWERASVLLDGAFTVGLDEAAAAVRLLAERVRVIAEGAGALAPAVALSGRAGGGTVVAVVSGGNIDFAVLCRILGGESP
jgi:threonine dehydratase